MAAVALATQERITMSALAREEIKASDGNTKDAIAALSLRLQNDKRLLKEVVADAIFAAAGAAVQTSMRQTRESLVAASVRAKDGVIALANGLTASLLDFPLAGGIRLREAMPEQVQKQIAIYENMSRDMSHKARWLKHVIQGVPHGKRVGDVVTAERAQELWENTTDA